MIGLGHFDVVILGGGPAGSAAGMTLLKREGTSVALVEASDYASLRIGESLSPGIRPLLDYLGLWERFRSQQPLESFASRAAWGSDSAQALDYMFTLHGKGWALDRARFDRMLAEAFRDRGGRLLSGTRFMGCERTPGGEWEVRVRGPDKAEGEIHCRYLIDATGRSSRLAAKLGAVRTVHDRLVGVGRVGRLSGGSSLESAILVEACPYGWWYTSPVPGNRISALLMSDADIVGRLRAARPDRWRSLLEEMKLTRRRVAGARFNGAPKAFPCHSSCLRQAGGEHWVAVGDAAASHDPLSSSGIPHAIGSGVHGALAAADALNSKGGMLEVYQRNIQRDFRQYLRTHWQYYRRETRWPDSLFWKRRTTPVSLDPNAAVERVEPLRETVHGTSAHLPAQVSRQLYESCRAQRLAHRIVRTFANAHPRIPDQQVILALQELVEKGLVKIHPPLAGTPRPASSQ